MGLIILFCLVVGFVCYITYDLVKYSNELEQEIKKKDSLSICLNKIKATDF